jgi:hypothetical protein
VTVIDRVFARHHTATARFKPTQIGGCVLWLDALERDSYIVTPRSGTTPDTATSITNLVSGVTATEAAATAPIFELNGLGGRPCWRGQASALRKIAAVEAAVAAAVNGTEKTFTAFYVFEPNQGSASADMWGLGNSAVASAGMVRFSHITSSGRITATRNDNAAATSSATRTTWPQRGPQVMAWRWNGSGDIDGWLNAEAVPNPNNSAPAALGALTTDRWGLFGQMDSGHGGYSNARLGMVLLYDGVLSDADILFVRTWANARWGSPGMQLSDISGVTSVALETFGTSGPDLNSWGNWTSVAGKLPLIVLDEHPVQCGKWIAANDDVMTFATSCGGGANGITLALKVKLDVLPAAGTFVTPISCKYGSGDDWFEVAIANNVAGAKTISFARQSGLSGNWVGFDIDTPAQASNGLDGGWHRLVVTYDGAGTAASDYRAWWDGVEKTVETSAAYTRLTGDKGSLGARCTSADVTTQRVDAKILREATYPRVLSDIEIAQVNSTLGEGWKTSPELFPSCVAWIDLLEPASHGTGSDNKTRWVKNLISGVIWEELTNPPDYVVVDGKPWIKGNRTNMHITTTEPAVCAALSGTDNGYTVMMVVLPDVSLAGDETYVGAGHSARNPAAQSSLSCGTAIVDGQWRMFEWDDGSNSAGADTNAVAINQAQVLTFVSNGTTGSIYINDATTPSMSDSTYDNGLNTLNVFSLLRRPGSVPDQYTGGAVGTVLVFNNALPEADRLGFVNWLIARRSIGFNPQSIASLKLWLDMRETAYYTVTPGSPDTVTAIRNLASGALWNTVAPTAGAAFPEFEDEGMNGYASMRGGSISEGGSTNRGIGSAETAVADAFSGVNKAFTVISVTQAMKEGLVGTNTLFSAANSAFANNGSVRCYRAASGNGRTSLTKTDDVGTAVSREAPTNVSTSPLVVTRVSHGATCSLYENHTAVLSGGAFSSATAVTPDRSALFCRPDSNADTFSVDRLSSHLVFDGDIGLVLQTKVINFAAARYGIAA